ncbi:MAG TPA: ATP-binding cassette domain-containing protein, partial [Tissierellaceae bacterium]|nr:ATP-binding cassette domain-containing protein [Tissierellaceae bacterium]
MIETKNLSLTYENGTEALKDVNIKIDSGDIVYIIGPSGSGKTSLLKLFMGIEYPTVGEVNVLGLNIEKGESKKIRKLRTKIGPVFQEFKLIRGRTSLENVMMG